MFTYKSFVLIFICLSFYSVDYLITILPLLYCVNNKVTIVCAVLLNKKKRGEGRA